MNEETYLLFSKEKRQTHLDLDEPCLYRGGNSTNHRGVLAEYLNTNIFSRPLDLCHACHDKDCSNPKHLYWGTRKENVADAIVNGTFKSPFERLVEKHGYDKACAIVTNNGRLGWSKGGMAGKGKPKSEEHRRKLSEANKKQ